MHHDTNVQGLLALHGTSTENNSTLQLARPLNMPHWMSSKQVHQKDMPPQSGIAEEFFPSNVQTKSGSIHSFPSSKFRFGSDRPSYPNVELESLVHEARSSSNFQRQLPAGLPPFKRDVQQEEPKVVFKEDALSAFLYGQGKHAAKGCLADLPTLSLGHSNGNQWYKRVDESSWVSKFPFQIAVSSELPECGQVAYSGERISHNLLTNPYYEGPGQDACKAVANVSSQLIASKGHIDHHKSLSELSPCSVPARNGILAKKASPSGFNSCSPCPLPQTVPVSNVFLPKQDWNATLVENVTHTQVHPDLFFQTTGVSNASQSHSVLGDDKNINIFDKLGSRANETKNGFSVSSSSSAFCTSSINAMTKKEWKMSNGEEAFKAMSALSEQDIRKSPMQVALIGVKHEILPEGCETREPTVEYRKIASSQGRVLTEALSFTAGSAVNRVRRQPTSITSVRDAMVGNSQAAELVLFRDGASTEKSTIVSTGVSTLPLLQHSPNFLILEGGKAPSSKNDPLHKDWGAFLAAPRSVRQASETDGKAMLPFQQRFEQLQKFLRQCDGSERDYCTRAYWSLSGSERSNHSAELQSRAARLSSEEGKEMKRAKLLNMLDDGPLVDARASTTAPSFSASTRTAVVKEG